MASPIGHTLSGLALYAAARGRGRGGWPPLEEGLGVLAASNLPDLDLVAGLMAGDSSRWHHQYTHSLLFALTVSICIYLAAVLVKKSSNSGLRWALLGGALVLLHLFLDLFTLDLHPPIGLQVFWPFKEGYYAAPWPILERVERGWPSVRLLKVWFAIGFREVLIFGPILMATLFWKRKDRKSG